MVLDSHGILFNSQGLEGFKLVEKMGDGAFSNVYKAIDRTSGQKVAGETSIYSSIHKKLRG
jgi:serine/threonine protein kinase